VLAQWILPRRQLQTLEKTMSKTEAVHDYNTVTIKELPELIMIAVMTPMTGTPGTDDCIWGLTLNIEGEPGIGKTSIINAIGAATYLHTVSLRAAPHPPEDFAGALIPDGHGDAKQICALPAVRDVIKRGKGIIFLDEINGGTPATQGALQSFIGERLIGEEKLPNEVRLIAASNPQEIATGGYRLAPAVANRMVHIHDQISAEDWVEWNMSGTKLQIPSVYDLSTRVEKGWLNEFAKARGIFSSFIKANPKLLLDRPPLHHPNCGKAWPSPRTWDYAQRVWATCKILKKDKGTTLETLLEGCVGVGAAGSLNEYAAKLDLPEPEDVLNGKWKISTDRLDITMTAYAATAAYVTGMRPDSSNGDNSKQLDAAARAWSSLKPLLDNGLSDIAIPAIRALSAAGLGRRCADQTVKDKSKEILVPLSKDGTHRYLGLDDGE
jgi:hypothetical protein